MENHIQIITKRTDDKEIIAVNIVSDEVVAAAQKNAKDIDAREFALIPISKLKGISIERTINQDDTRIVYMKKG